MSYPDAEYIIERYEQEREAVERRALEDAMEAASGPLAHQQMVWDLELRCVAQPIEEGGHLDQATRLLVGAEMVKSAHRMQSDYIHSLWVGKRTETKTSSRTVDYEGVAGWTSSERYVGYQEALVFGLTALAAASAIMVCFPLGVVLLPWLAYKAAKLVTGSWYVGGSTAYTGTVQAPCKEVSEYIDPFVKGKIQTDDKGRPRQRTYSMCMPSALDRSALVNYLDTKPAESDDYKY